MKKLLGRKIAKKLLAQVFVLSAFTLACATANAESIKVRFAHTVSEDTPKGQMAAKFKELIADRVGLDKLDVEIYPNSTLFNDSQIGDALLKGEAEFGAPSLSKLKPYTKRFQLFDIPFLFVSPQAASNFLNGDYGDRMLRLVGRKGLKGLGFLDNGMKQFSASKQMKTPKDAENLKFRITNSDVLEAQFKQINAIPIKQPEDKLFYSLASKTLDGQESTWSNIYSQKYHQHQPYIIESNHGYLGYMIVTSKKFWKSLPDDIKPEVKKAMDEAIAYGNELARKKANDDRQNIIGSGKSKIHKLTVEERISWVTAMQPVWGAYEDEIGTELIQAAASSR